ncbi:VanW family protein [Candidatus Woesebacteria bacterium]|nr:MAG: VanW family protein [Candidatus Woesebacteria bacterium]
MTKKISKRKIFFATLLGVLIAIVITTLSATLYYQERIYPNIWIAGVVIENHKVDTAKNIIKNSVSVPDTMGLFYNETRYSIPLADLKLEYDFDQTVENAYKAHRSSTKPNLLEVIQSLNTIKEIELVYKIDETVLNSHISVIADEIVTQPVFPSLIATNKKIDISKGSKGTDINVNQLTQTILDKLSTGNFSDTLIQVSEIDPTLNDDQALHYQNRGNSIFSKQLTFVLDDTDFTYDGSQLLLLIDPLGKYKEEEVDKVYSDLAIKVERSPLNPVFVFENNKVTEFKPATKGITIVKDDFATLLESAVWELETTDTVKKVVDIPVIKTLPEIDTGDVNNLGINERIGLGESSFTGSISSRIHNIGVAAKNFNGVLVAPGDTLSFNAILGDVSTLTGYLQAYVIKDGKTVLGDGGGVCQVSTTLFRAALNAGLPIVERRSHSYRVSYYEQNSAPGLDATVYAPTTDLKIQNDTPSHILIQTLFDPKLATLDVEIYGTSDGRIVSLTKPIITSQSPPPEDFFQDDPGLPIGTVKQIDWAAWGAKVQFNYKVTRNGEVLQEKTFFSNYRPWQAKFLRGTGPVI